MYDNCVMYKMSNFVDKINIILRRIVLFQYSQMDFQTTLKVCDVHCELIMRKLLFPTVKKSKGNIYIKSRQNKRKTKTEFVKSVWRRVL